MQRQKWQRSRFFLVLAFAGTAIVVVMMLNWQAAMASNSGPGNVLTPPPAPNPNVTLGTTPVHPVPLGIPAIPVRAALANSTGPHFTAADVEQWVASHPMLYAAQGTPHPTVTSVQFLTAKAVSAQLRGASMGVPDSTLLCLVTLDGTFQIPSPSGPSRLLHTGFLVFDAHTGNLLMNGFGI